MLRPASELTSFYKFPMSRCEFALNGVRERALALGQDEIAQLAERAIDEVRRSMRIVLSFDGGHSGLYAPEARSLDVSVDRIIAALQGYLGAQIRAYHGEPRAAAATRISRVLFPNGVASVVRLPFAEEHAQINMLLERAADDDLAGDIALLPELPELLARLTERNREYGDALRAGTGVPTRDDVNEARATCQERLAEVAALIIGLYALRTPEDTEGRDHLLQPILEQNDAIRVARRQRQLPTDVDPETGEELGPDSSAGDLDEELDDPAGDSADDRDAAREQAQ